MRFCPLFAFIRRFLNFEKTLAKCEGGPLNDTRYSVLVSQGLRAVQEPDPIIAKAQPECTDFCALRGAASRTGRGGKNSRTVV